MLCFQLKSMMSSWNNCVIVTQVVQTNMNLLIASTYLFIALR